MEKTGECQIVKRVADLLSGEAGATLPGRGFSSEAQVTKAGFEPKTSLTPVERHNVVNDFGDIANPEMAEGQVRYGAARWAGQTLSEHRVFDESTWRLTATFMEYAMLRADIVLKTGFVTDVAVKPELPDQWRR